MNDLFELYYFALVGWIILSVPVLFVLIKLNPPTYGRHVGKHGLFINNSLGWFLMELPTLFIIPIFFLFSSIDFNIVNACFIFLYVIHYMNRVFIFPFRLRTKGKSIPVSIVVSAIFFNLFNTFFLGYYFGNFAYDVSWFSSPQFIIGLSLFFIGAFINNQSDSILINLRKGSENGYKIPYGGLFKYVSCPNHLGEIVEWVGFAILTWSLPAFAFALWTVSNLLPRAMSHHKWYHKKFVKYPENRKAIFPFIL